MTKLNRSVFPFHAANSILCYCCRPLYLYSEAIVFCFTDVSSSLTQGTSANVVKVTPFTLLKVQLVNSVQYSDAAMNGLVTNVREALSRLSSGPGRAIVAYDCVCMSGQ